mgnify:CR=1 FL=1
MARLRVSIKPVVPCCCRFKCAPPIRERENQGRIWQGLQQGVIDGLSTDHSPSEPSLRLLEEGDFVRAWGGIAGGPRSFSGVACLRNAWVRVSVGPHFCGGHEADDAGHTQQSLLLLLFMVW